MGFLGIATPLPWEESKKYLKYVREHGVEQFLATYERLKVSAEPARSFTCCPTTACRVMRHNPSSRDVGVACRCWMATP